MNNLEKAKEILFSESLTCCFTDGERLYKSRERGVKPLLSFLEQKIDPQDLCAADKVVGKAAAYLYILLGIKCIYADIISEKALEVFERFSVDVSFRLSVPAIKNRAGTGFCPMESAVADIDDPNRAFCAIKKKLAELAGK